MRGRTGWTLALAAAVALAGCGGDEEQQQQGGQRAERPREQRPVPGRDVESLSMSMQRTFQERADRGTKNGDLDGAFQVTSSVCQPDNAPRSTCNVDATSNDGYIPTDYPIQGRFEVELDLRSLEWSATLLDPDAAENADPVRGKLVKPAPQ